MNQFHWKGSQATNNKSAATVNPASTKGDLSGIKIEPNQSYRAQIVPMASTQANSQTAPTNRQASNQHAKSTSQIHISVPQANGQNVTISQPLPQLPQGTNVNQQVQVLLNVTKTGELTITLSPDKNTQASAAAAATTSQAQTIKLSLSNNQIVELLSLNKAFKNITNSPTSSSQSTQQQTTMLQTTAQVVQLKNQLPQIKLPGTTSNIKLPDNIASLLQGQKQVSVTLTPKGNDIELQINLAQPQTKAAAKSGQASTALTTTITAEKLSPIIKQALKQSSNQQIHIDKQPSGDKITLANQQTINIGSKVATLQQGAGQLKLNQLNASQLSIQVSNKNTEQATTIKVNMPATQISSELKQALVSSTQAQSSPSLTKTDGAKVLSATQVIENGKIVTNSKVDSGETNKASAKTLNQTQTEQQPTAPIATTKSNPDLQMQKQALQQFIDPLVRLLLPKKQNWSEGFKTLAALEQSLKPNSKSLDPQNQSKTVQINQQASNQTLGQNNNLATSNQNNIDLKQLINQVKEAIPDHTSNLDDKTITAMVTEILNFSPTKTATPSLQPTPANAIANALQLLLGAKLSQGEAKLSNQLQQQLQQLIKPMAPKAPATEAGVKNAIQGLNNLDQATGSLKALTGIQSTIRHQQVENVEKRLDGNNQLEFNFPLRVDNQVKELHIAINEEKHKSETSSSRLSIWNLNLTFDLNDFGKLLVNAKLKDGEVSMHMYAEQPKTLSLMKQFSATLEQRLEFHGVKINNIQSSLGKISSTNSKRQLNSLVQIKV